MPTVSRRSLLKGAALTATAIALGWRPDPELPIGNVIPAPLEPIATLPAAGGVVRMRATALVSSEFLIDQDDAADLVRSFLEEAIRTADAGLRLEERVGASDLHAQRTLTGPTEYALVESWRARPA